VFFPLFLIEISSSLFTNHLVLAILTFILSWRESFCRVEGLNPARQKEDDFGQVCCVALGSGVFASVIALVVVLLWRATFVSDAFEPSLFDGPRVRWESDLCEGIVYPPVCP